MPSFATASWNSGTALNTILQMSVSSISGAQVNIFVTGTVTGATLVFEVSDDNVNFFPVVGLVQTSFAIFTNWQPSFGSPASFQLNTNGWNYFQVRLSGAVVGSGSVTVGVSPCPASMVVLVPVIQQNGANMHVTLDDGAGGTPANVTVKGTQGTNALAVQDLHDSGRAGKVFTAGFTSTAIAETPISFQVSSDGGVLSGAAVSYTVTAGKKFRVMGITAQMRAGGTTPAASTATLKMKVGGNLQGMAYQIAVPTTLNASPAVFPGIIVLADGWELPAGAVISFTLALTTWTATTNTPIIDIGLIGYEY